MSTDSPWLQGANCTSTEALSVIGVEKVAPTPLASGSAPVLGSCNMKSYYWNSSAGIAILWSLVCPFFFSFPFFFNLGPGEMAQQLGALLLFQKMWVQFPAHRCWITTVCNSSTRESNPFFCSVGTPDTHIVCRHTCRQNTHTYKNR